MADHFVSPRLERYHLAQETLGKTPVRDPNFNGTVGELMNAVIALSPEERAEQRRVTAEHLKNDARRVIERGAPQERTRAEERLAQLEGGYLPSIFGAIHIGTGQVVNSTTAGFDATAKSPPFLRNTQR